MSSASIPASNSARCPCSSSSKPCVVTAYPGGTGNPACVRSPRCAHLPPTRATSSRPSARKGMTYTSVEDRDDPGVTVDTDPIAVLICFVACPVPTTAGRPYSRAMIAAWDIIPPMSETAAAIFGNTGPSSAPSPSTRARRPAAPSRSRSRRGRRARGPRQPRRSRVPVHAALIARPARPGAEPLGGDAPEELDGGIVDHLRNDAERGGGTHSASVARTSLRRATRCGQ